jgi:hypothetical protein
MPNIENMHIYEKNNKILSSGLQFNDSKDGNGDRNEMVNFYIIIRVMKVKKIRK